ncbi:MAG: carboxylating nicotinate-nucleotide diphosphorylase [Candidatus Krumholzibacteria bacterium]|nr:carboxylating nicotinate-nucleotide diphosphorylase [Candidatus Krumholzibacteria bacterium]
MYTNALPDRAYLEKRIDQALREDGAEDDCTVAFLGLGERMTRGTLIAREYGVIAGIDLARMVFSRMNPTIRFDAKIQDGECVQEDDLIALVAGPGSAILSAERVALNFMQHLSGVATLTAKFVDVVRGTGVRILDTRKTTPLLRPLERYAVRVGGGNNHRYNLSDMILIKENHVHMLGGPAALTAFLAAANPDRKIEVEVDSIDFLRGLLGRRVARIMLDNFSPDEVRQAIGTIKAYQKKQPSFTPEIEVSGGVDLKNIKAYAMQGPDYISIGALTHSAAALDISPEVGPP